MASDAFTAADATALEDLPNWAKSTGSGSITVSSNQIRASAWADARYYRTDSSVDKSEVKWCVEAADFSKGPSVRAGASTRGYRCSFSDLSGGNWTKIVIYKDAAATWYLTGLTYDAASDWYMRIEVSGTTTVTIKVFVGSTPNPTSQVGSDQTDATSPIGAGAPGVFINSGSSNTAHYLDDWTDGASGDVESSSSDTLPAGVIELCLPLVRISAREDA